MEIPQAFISRMSALLGDEFGAFLASYECPPSTSLRANTLKLPAQGLRALLPFEVTPVPWSDEAFLVPSSEGGLADDGKLGKHPYHAAGLYYVQDPSALAPVIVLDPKPGERVLDLAAAPGGKATHIAARLQGQGLLVANEMHPKRVWDLAENLERWGARNVAVTNEVPERLAERLPAFFDAVLLDAPCSGEGMFRKSAAARQEWRPQLVEGCAFRQQGILEQAARLVRPGGRLVYATCTFAPAENEANVARFLRSHPEFELLQAPARPGFIPGRPDWLSGGPLGLSELSRTVRLWPHLGPGEGHFAALLTRSQGSDPPPHREPAWHVRKLSRSAEAAYRTFRTETLVDAPVTDAPVMLGTYLYALPAGLPDLAKKGLRFIHPGWWLGVVKKDRFEPSHALALGLRVEAARRIIDLPSTAPELAAYLRAETLPGCNDEGWVLMAVDGHPLGWARCAGGRLKSRYPKGLRWT